MPILCQKLTQCPEVVGKTGFHGRGNAERAVDSHEIVIGEIQGEAPQLQKGEVALPRRPGTAWPSKKRSPVRTPALQKIAG